MWHQTLDIHIMVTGLTRKILPLLLCCASPYLVPSVLCWRINKPSNNQQQPPAAYSSPAHLQSNFPTSYQLQDDKSLKFKTLLTWEINQFSVNGSKISLNFIFWLPSIYSYVLVGGIIIVLQFVLFLQLFWSLLMFILNVLNIWSVRLKRQYYSHLTK